MVTALIFGFGLLICVFLGFVAYGFFAPLKVHFTTSLKPSNFQGPVADVAGRPFVGLALSGGGARAAVFAAAGMEALAAKGLLDQVTHVSSVSGGGFTASYWALNPMPKGGDAAYFAAMQTAVAHDFQLDIHRNQINTPSRLLSPSRRLSSLQEALSDKGFVANAQGGDATLADLPGTRAFFFNAVSYDTGRRFVISNHPLPAPAAKTGGRLPDAIRTLSFSDSDTQRSAPSDFPISLAVATSAAFPPYVGPVTVQIDDAAGRPAQYWHLGDGGLLENSGIETLREAVYAQPDCKHATIYSFDGGQRLVSDLTKADISVFSRDITQLVDVILTYAGGHRDTVFETLDAVHGVDIEQVTFDYFAVEDIINDPDLGEKPPSAEEIARWSSWDGWDAHAVSVGGPTTTPNTGRATSPTPLDRLRRIPTGFSISVGDRDLIAAAAKFLVDHLTP